MSRPWGRPRCAVNGVDAPCAWPGCCVAGEQLVILGPHAVHYFERLRVLDVQHGRLVATWSWVESRVVNLVAVGRAG